MFTNFFALYMILNSVSLPTLVGIAFKHLFQFNTCFSFTIWLLALKKMKMTKLMVVSILIKIFCFNFYLGVFFSCIWHIILICRAIFNWFIRWGSRSPCKCCRKWLVSVSHLVVIWSVWLTLVCCTSRILVSFDIYICLQEKVPKRLR